MKTQIILLTVIVGVLAAGSAYAATDDTGGDARRNRFEQVDTDGDGRIDKQEFAKVQDVRFDKMDANSDGAITLAELEDAARRDRIERRFKRMDADGDGQVTRAEFAAAGEQMFEHLDENGDGFLSMGELESRKHGGRRSGAADN